MYGTLNDDLHSFVSELKFADRKSTDTVDSGKVQTSVLRRINALSTSITRR